MIKVAKKLSHLVSAVVFFVGLLLVQSVSADDYVVIINKANPYSSGETDKAKKDIRLFYLKNQSQWPHSEKVKPYGLISTDQAQLAFNEKVLNMSSAELTQHWLNKKQTTGETPPKALKSDRAVITLVSKREGAFGIISSESAAKLPDTVKVLFTF